MKKLQRGFLLTIEGIDGCGKSLLAQKLATHLKSIVTPIVCTKEPAGSSLGAPIKKLLLEHAVPISPKAEFLLFAADRAQHYQELIKPALICQSLVISDRFADSSYAYQGYGRGLSVDLINTVNRWVLEERLPDCTIYLRLPVSVALTRIEQRNEGRTHFEKAQFIEKVSQGFDALFADRHDVITID